MILGKRQVWTTFFRQTFTSEKHWGGAIFGCLPFFVQKLCAIIVNIKYPAFKVLEIQNKKNRSLRLIILTNPPQNYQ